MGLPDGQVLSVLRLRNYSWPISLLQGQGMSLLMLTVVVRNEKMKSGLSIAQKTIYHRLGSNCGTNDTNS
jgi:hypothetical protein